jgi:peptidyl-prolyl cis-trans isomerase B (cyclophilin B)
MIIRRIALTIVFLSLFACGKEPMSKEVGCKNINVSCLKGYRYVLLQTERGSITLQLDGDRAPLTSGNFLDLVKRGIYDNTTFHRVVRTPTPFVVQGGDPLTSDPKVLTSTYGTGNYIDPSTGEARFIPLEFHIKTSSELVYGRELPLFSKPYLLSLKHDRGSLAMARSSDPNSASSQFYIALKPLPELDGRYAVFGRVIQGMDVVDRLRQGDKLTKASETAYKRNKL